MSPRRIQLSRAKGWRKPEGAVVVARPSRWGNPFTIKPVRNQCNEPMFAVLWPDGQDVEWCYDMRDARRVAVLMFEPPADVEALRGRDLACWCPLDHACHADVLLDVANRKPPAQPHDGGTSPAPGALPGETT